MEAVAGDPNGEVAEPEPLDYEAAGADSVGDLDIALGVDRDEVLLMDDEDDNQPQQQNNYVDENIQDENVDQSESSDQDEDKKDFVTLMK